MSQNQQVGANRTNFRRGSIFPLVLPARKRKLAGVHQMTASGQQYVTFDEPIKSGVSLPLSRLQTLQNVLLAIGPRDLDNLLHPPPLRRFVNENDHVD